MKDDRTPLRVCFVVGYFFPLQSGAERQALEQGAELVHQGHAVRVLTRRVPGLLRDDVVRGVRVHRWVRVRRWGPLFGLGFLAGFARALGRLRGEIDVVHTHQALWEAAAAGLFRGRSGSASVPVVVQPASSGWDGEAQELRRTRGSSLLRHLILRADRVAAISDDIAREWTALGFDPARIVPTASGVDTTRYRPGPGAFEAALPPRPRVLFTGRLHPQKNLSMLLKAWSGVRARTPAHLVLLGEGPERAALLDQARSLGVADSVHLPGAVADAAEHLRSADLFVLPSRAEGMSNSLLEAMATALPCLASRIGGNTDLIDDGRTGLLLPADAPAAWADALAGLLTDPTRARRLGDAARARIEDAFALDRVVARNVDMYRSLIGPAGRTTPNTNR